MYFLTAKQLTIWVNTTTQAQSEDHALLKNRFTLKMSKYRKIEYWGALSILIIIMSRIFFIFYSTYGGTTVIRNAMYDLQNIMAGILLILAFVLVGMISWSLKRIKKFA